jgi:hypothetical protein
MPVAKQPIVWRNAALSIFVFIPPNKQKLPSGSILNWYLMRFCAK